MHKNKKVVVFGGGTGLSYLLRGLKNFPIDISAVVSVCDDGKSSGRLREEFKIPAVGDVRRVLISLAEVEPVVSELLNYRFKTNSDLNGHTVGNLLLTAATDITGSMGHGIKAVGETLNLKGKVIPFTEDDNVTLIGKMEDGSIIEGEHSITSYNKQIIDVYYKEKPKVNPDVLLAVKEADLIILSMGSVYTSIIPNLLASEVIKEIEDSKAPILYACNMMTQPGETDNFKASDHVKLLNNYLGKRNVDILLINNGIVTPEIQKKYETLEQKDQVVCDYDELVKLNTKVIQDNFVIIEDEMIRHNVVKLALQIFSLLI